MRPTPATAGLPRPPARRLLPRLYLLAAIASAAGCARSAESGKDRLDLLVAADLGAGPDLAPVADLATADLVTPDLAPPPDLATPPDLGAVPDLTYSFFYYFEYFNKACPQTPMNNGPKAPGQPCTASTDCRGTCCSCNNPAQTYWGGACINARCADAVAACALIVQQQPVVCR